MVGTGQWVTTHDEKSVGLFLADIEMRCGLERQWAQDLRELWHLLWRQARRGVRRVIRR